MAASTDGGISISPPFQEVSLSSTENQTFPLVVENHSDTIATFHLSVLDFGSLNESGGVAFLGGTNNLEQKYSLASWMHPASDTLSIDPGKSESTTITIENRDDLSPGGHYAAVVLRSPANENPDASHRGIAIDQIYSVLVFVKKTGGEKYGLSLSNANFAHRTFFLPERVELRFQNTGNIHVVPRGVISVLDPRGRLVSKVAINDASSVILPETFRIYPETLRSIGNSFIPGKYTLRIEYRYDGKDDFVVQEERFYHFPLTTLLSLVILLGIGMATLFFRLKRRKESQPLSLDPEKRDV